MTDIQFYSKFHTLPKKLKDEVADFIDFLQSKKSIKSKKNTPKFGCAKGQFIMSADFDEPLDDFKEYM